MEANKSEKRDVTAQIQAEAALKLSEAKYRRLYNETPVLMHSIDRDTKIVEVNDYWLRTLGYEQSEVLGRKVTDFYTDASKKYAQEVIQPAFFRDGIAKDVHYQFVKQNGNVIDVLLSATAERDAAGNVVRSQAVIQDITEKKRVEEELGASEERFRVLSDAAFEAIAITENGIFLDANRQMCDLIGYTVDELKGSPVSNIIAPEDRDLVRQHQSSEYEAPYENHLLHRDGTVILVESRARYFTLNNRNVRVTVLRDITERKQAENALKESEERFRAITMTASDAILLMDDKGKIVYWNPSAERIFGYSAEEALGKDLHVFLAPQRLHHGYQKGFAKFVVTGQGPVVNKSVEMDAMKKDGTEFPIEVSTSAMKIGNRWHALGIVRDITERKRLEQEIIKTQKLESIGTLAGGIAHDFNNLLQGIFGFISLAKMTIEQKDKALAMLDQAEKALHQSVNLTTQLLTFSKGGKPLKKIFNLRPMIEDAVRFSLSGSSVDHSLLIDKDIWLIDADEGQIAQVIQNIVINAEQSMPLGGRIEITARNAPAGAVARLPNDLRGDLVEITVCDQGTGIPPEHLPRIFDPYFTTKERGSGLGLATSYSIIRNHGGVINVSSELGKGSTFTIYLPASNSSLDQASASQELTAGRKGRILVMDDEKMVRDVAGALIDSLGHKVAFAEHGESAISQYSAAMDAGRPFDIVVLDLTIKGGMGGLETIQKLLEIDPAVKALVSSGYSDDASMSDYRSKGFKAFLKKPYNIENLSSILNEMLASG